MNGSFAVVVIMGSPQLFAINGYDLGIGELADGFYPPEETVLKLLGI
jgi:hypothetical protein